MLYKRKARINYFRSNQQENNGKCKEITQKERNN